MFLVYLEILNRIKNKMIQTLFTAEQFMKNEGSELVQRLTALGVSVWKIHKACGVSYQTARAWKKGWWNPDQTHTSRLYTMLKDLKLQRNIF